MAGVGIVVWKGVGSLEPLNPTRGDSAELFWTKKSMLASFNIRSPIARTLNYSDDRNTNLAPLELSFFTSMSNYNRIENLSFVQLICLVSGILPLTMRR